MYAELEFIDQAHIHQFYDQTHTSHQYIAVGVLLQRMGKEKIELTSKEADLFGLLHASANETIERTEILKQVWGDDGDYVGRTLDVFVSKLRKKLEADAKVKIANIRGVGYRLMC